MSIPATIILIDNDPIFNFIHTKIIATTKLGITVQAFNNVANALAALRNAASVQDTDHYYTIFVDINMPVQNGWDFLESFSRLSPIIINSCKIFMLTSSNDSFDIEKSRTFPVVYGYISKPLTIQKVLEITAQE